MAVSDLTLYVTIIFCCLEKFSSAERTLSITVKSNLLESYIDGIFSMPPQDGNWNTADNLTFADNSRLIAVSGGEFTMACPGILASVTNDFLVTNGNWKCSGPPSIAGWNTLGFDDSQWAAAYVIGPNGNVISPELCAGLAGVPSISANAYWIWTASISDGAPFDSPIYCRGYLPICEQQNPCLNGGTCHSNTVEICSCTPEYIGTYCETEKRSNLVVTSHDSLTEVYIDGVWSALPNRNDMNATDTVPVPTHGRLISVMAVSTTDNCPGLIAYVTQSTIVTDAGWKCSPFADDDDWSQLGFDDSAWPSAVVLGKNGDVPGCENLGFIQGIGQDANWIWTEYSTQDPKQSDKAVFCRAYVPACQTTSPCLNGGTCLDNDKNMCKCTPEWAGTYCDQVNNPCFYDPCLNNGTCVIIANRYECVCLPDYVGIHCDRKVPERSLTITVRHTLNSLYVDDNLMPLVFPGEWNTSDVIALSTEARLIAVMATDLTATCAGILASVTGDYLVSDVTWKCNRTIADFPPNWFQLGYDDSTWTSAYVIGRNGNVTAPPACASIPLIPSISGNAFWIWTSSIANAPTYDETVYCRGYMPTCQHDNPCRNNATCNRNSFVLCSCLSGFTGKYCESLVDRKWTITAKSTLLNLYVDGIQADFPNADNVTASDIVSLKPYARLIAVSALDSTNTCPGILGSATDDYLLTDATWKCTAQEVAGWTAIGFDDSLWQQAYPIGYNGGQKPFPECDVLPTVPSVSPNAFWIWTDFSTAISGYDPIVYCRGYLPLCQVYNPCFNGGVCNANNPVVCSCLFGFSGTFCENEDTKSLSFTADRSLSAAYVDGVPLELSNPETPSAIDSATIRADARLLAMMAVKTGGDCPGIIASVYDGSDYFLTGAAWKCSSQAKFGWFQLGFDDTTWAAAQVIQANQDTGANPCPGLPLVSGISPNANWIWTSSLPTHHVTVYCRGYLPTCQFTTCANGGTCNPNSPVLCTCAPGYTGVRCESLQ